MVCKPVLAVVAAALAVVVPGASAAAQGQAAAAAQQGLFSVDDIRADFQELYRTLERAHFNLFENVPRDDYDRLFDQISAEITAPLDRFQAAELFQRFAAYGRIAHARVDAAFERYARYRDAGGGVFPLTLRFEGRRAFVLENRSGGTEPAEGAEVLTIDGVAVGAWFDQLRSRLSADTDYLAASLLEYYFARLLWLEAGPAPGFVLSYRHEDRPGTVFVPARNAAQIAAVVRPGRLRLDTEGREARVLPGGVAYLRPGPFYNNVPDAVDMYDNRAFMAFVDAAFRRFRDSGARALIVDLRDNPGGDSSFSDHLVSWFATRPFRFASSFRIRTSTETIASNDARLRAAGDRRDEASARMAAIYARAGQGGIVAYPVNETRPRPEPRFTGRVYILVDRQTYSNAVNVAALVQDHRFGIVLGEETADLATTLGAMESFALSRTGIRVGYPKAEIVRASGSRIRRGVVPDIAIRIPVVQPDSDPVLERATAIARGRYE